MKYDALNLAVAESTQCHQPHLKSRQIKAPLFPVISTHSFFPLGFVSESLHHHSIPVHNNTNNRHSSLHCSHHEVNKTTKK